MIKKLFVDLLWKDAVICQQKTGIHPLATLAQAAVESGWGEHAPGNMYFGQKDFDGLNGNEQLITTFEYNKSATLTPKQIGLETIDSIKPVLIQGVKFFKYSGKSYFRKYETPSDCFVDHCEFILKNKRYKKALEVKDDPYAFIDALAAAGYAQSPDYASLLKQIARSLEMFIPQEKTERAPILKPKSE